MSRKGNKTAFGYNSVVSTDRRRPLQTRSTSEGFILSPKRREAAASTARDDRRNMTILAWMVRRHLDSVSRFTPHFRFAGKSEQVTELNALVKKMLDWHSHKRQFDALGRHGRDEWLRMFEACKVISGDCAGLKTKVGKLQGIEGERIAKRDSNTITAKVAESFSDSGIQFNPDGTRKAFMLCKRNAAGNDLEFERVVPAEDLVFDGYWPERFDSDRGVSPLLTALNEGADVRETWEWHLLKVKAAGIFGFAFTRTGRTDFTGQNPPSATDTSEYAEKVGASIKARGLINLDLDPGDDVKSIESQSPNPNVIPFTRELIRSVLLALDIPFTFYDSLTASFSARIADRNEYEEACESKRAKNADILDDIYGGWLFPMWAKANVFGFGDLVNKMGINLDEIAATLRWVPAGRPWLDRSNEMSGHILALTAGATSTPRICSSYGEDAYEIAREQKEYLEQAGTPLLYANGGQQAVQAIMAAMNGQKPAETGKGQDNGQADTQAQ
jgi:capsid protein